MMVSSMYGSEVAPVKSQQYWLPKEDLKIDISGMLTRMGELAQVPTSA